MLSICKFTKPIKTHAIVNGKTFVIKNNKLMTLLTARNRQIKLNEVLFFPLTNTTITNVLQNKPINPSWNTVIKFVWVWINKCGCKSKFTASNSNVRIWKWKHIQNQIIFIVSYKSLTSEKWGYEYRLDRLD